jgi:hypothetical protein
MKWILEHKKKNAETEKDVGGKMEWVCEVVIIGLIAYTVKWRRKEDPCY